ncbi:MAG: ABC transporter permease [Halobacteriaceae archaeon]
MATESSGENPQVQFDDIDWETERSGPRFTLRTKVFVLVMLGLVAFFGYDYFIVGPGEPTFSFWNATALDWVYLPSLVILFFFGILPLILNPRLAKRYWNQFKKDKLAVLSLLYIVMFFFVGALGPTIIGKPSVNVFHGEQPPFWTSISMEFVGSCVGPVVNGYCQGTLQYPLGTTPSGMNMINVVVVGMRVALQVALMTSMLIIPIATIVGTTAAYFGGRIDEIIMRYIDLQQAVPALFIYLILRFILGPSLFLLIMTFGLLSWGSVARLVRSEALQQSQEAYIMAANSAGSSRFDLIMNHLVPNVSNTVIAATTLQIPRLILLEAALSFLELGGPLALSWGQYIAQGMDVLLVRWWISIFPTIALFITVLAFQLFGDALRDALDPRSVENIE